MSCLETYATLRIFSKSISPDEIASVLGVEPTSSVPIDPDSKYRNRREWNLWRWSTQTTLTSTDNLEHIRSILNMLSNKSALLAQLRSQGCQTDIFCYWVSSGQGGPHLDNPTICALAELGLEVSWDMYFGEEEEYAENGPPAPPGDA